MKPGEVIKELRIQKGLTQSELSERTHITLRTIQRIENNEVKPSMHSVNELSKVLQVDILNLSKKTPENPNKIEFTFKINDMNQLLSDIKSLVRNNWKLLLLIALLITFLTNYTDIKAGISDGWKGQ